MVKRIILSALFLIEIFALVEGQYLRYSSECSVPLCSSNTNNTCSSSTPCYSYQTATNQIICAPRVDCSLFDACTANRSCASNTSVCIVNSCCCQSICMPLSTISACSTNSNSNVTQNSTTTTATVSTVRTTTSTTRPSSTTTAAGAVGSLLYGVQRNFSTLSMPNGWSLCYSSTYNIALNTTVLNSILNVCNKGKLMLGCRPKNSPLLSVAAMGLRADVLFNCSTSRNCTKVANGVGWYFSTDYSWGFANNTDSVLRNQCDQATTNPEYRLCWHINAGGGYRCGNVEWLNSDATYERVIYHSN